MENSKKYSLIERYGKVNVIITLLCVIFLIINFANNKVNTLTYDEFMKALDSEEVTEMTVTTRGSAYTYQIKGKLSDYEENETFVAVLPLSDEVMKKIVEASDNQEFKLVVEPDPESSSLLIILVNVVPIILICGVAFWFLNKQISDLFDLVKSLFNF